MSTKAVQGKLWSIAPQYWAKHFEPWFLPMYRKVLEYLETNDWQSLLDAGCGAGLFSNLVIQTGAQVIGVDASPGLLDVARLRNPKNSFLEEDFEALPFADNSFEVVAGFNSFQYAGSFEKALVEAKRVVKPGGLIVLGIWDKSEKSDATEVLKAIESLLPPPPPGTPGPFALSEDGKMESAFEKIGMHVVYRASVPCPFIYSSLGDGIKSFMGTGPAAAAINNSNKQTVEATIAKALQPFHVVDDLHFLENQFLFFIARK